MDRQGSLEKLICRLERVLDAAASLPERIRLCRQGLERVRPQTPHSVVAKLHFELGFSLLSLTGQRSAENLGDAIAHLESARERYTPDEHWAEWSETVQNLALAYAWRHGGERAQDVERAIKLNTDLLSHASVHQDVYASAHAHYQLAQLYMHRTVEDRAGNLETAIAHSEQALQVWTRGTEPLRWARLQSVLGSLYFHRLGQDPIECLQASLEHLQQALDVLDPLSHLHGSDWAQAQHQLGLTLWQLGQLIDDQQGYLERSIRHFEQALRVRKRDVLPEAWAETQHRLAIAYLDRRAGDREENIVQAIDWLQFLASFYPERTARWAKVQNDLGVAYLKSVRGGRSESIERAIECFREACSAIQTSGLSNQEALILHNLAAAHEERLLGDRVENLRRAVGYCERALRAVEARDLIQWATIKADLVGILWRLGTQERVQSADRAAGCFEAAIAHGEALVAASDIQRLAYHLAFTCYNLGNAYSDRRSIVRSGEERDARSEDQERAIYYYSRALGFYTPENYPHRWANVHGDLGVTYLQRHRGNPFTNRQMAIRHLVQALRVLTPDAYPVEMLRVARNLAHTCFEMRLWTRAQERYAQAIQAADVLYRASLLRSSKQVELGQVTELYAHAAFALAKNRHQVQDAVVLLERGRARLLSEVLERDRAQLKGLADIAPEAYQQYMDAAERLRLLEEHELGEQMVLPQSQSLADAIRQARADLEVAVQGIRRVPGYEEFLQLPAFAQIETAVEPGCPLIYLAVTPAGTLALIFSTEHPGGSEIHPIWCDLTEKALIERVVGAANAPGLGGYLGAYARWQRSSRDLIVATAWQAAAQETPRWLWDMLMGPIVEALLERGMNRAVLIPQGWLGLLPLHAAWTEGSGGCRRYAMDDICFTYAPNARALLAAREAASGTQPDRLLAIDEPRPVKANRLPNSAPEVRAVRAHFERCQVLQGEAATREAVRQQLSKQSVLHFSCHGRAGFTQPLEGGLLLAHDEMLTLRQILALRLEKVRLAILSACETGIPGTELPDEVISLPTGLVQAGVAGVVASLWSVSDLSTMILMAQFYDLWKGEGLKPPEALRRAQCWVRDTTNGEKKTYLESKFGSEHLPASSVWSRPAENDFAHPVYWAAFTYTGA